MTNINLENIMSLCSEYKQFKRLEEEAKTAKDALRDKLFAVLGELKETKLIAGEYKITISSYQKFDIDKKRLESEHKAIYDAYLKPPTTTTRLLVS